MSKVWVGLISALWGTAALGQTIEPEMLPMGPVPMPADHCMPACAPCWQLNLCIPKHPLRTWLASCERMQKCAAYFSYYPPKRGSCCHKPDPSLWPPLYTFFWPVHCVDGDCGGCAAPHGAWNGTTPVVDEGFASAGTPVGTAQHVHIPQMKDEPWYRSMFGRRRKDKEPAGTVIVPVSGQLSR